MLEWRWLRRLTLRLRTLFQRDWVERELEEEFQFHIEQRTELEIARGLSRKKLVTPPSGRWMERSNERRNAAICAT